MISAFEPLKVADLSHTLKETWKESNSLELLKKGGTGKASSCSEAFLHLGTYLLLPRRNLEGGDEKRRK